MKNLILIILVQSAILWSQTIGHSNVQHLGYLDSLVEIQDYFGLKRTFEENKNQLSEEYLLYYRAIIYNVFNKYKESNEAIKSLLVLHDGMLDKKLLNKIYRTKLLNHINLYEYSNAALTSEFVLNNYRAFNDSSAIEMLENEINIWRALKNTPVQTVTKQNDITIPMKKDRVGLFNVDVTIADTTINLLFDTGANISGIKKSLADKLSLKIIESDFYVTAATGVKVKSHIAVAEKIKLGDFLFQNVVFLVINDDALSFPQIDYHPNGAIGFPVIRAMEEIHISKENKIFVPETPVEYSLNNFALDGLIPILAVEYNKDTLRFHFDTGANRTSLFPKFFIEFKEEVESKYLKEVFKSGSGGGIKEFEGYVLNNVMLKVGNSQAVLEKVRLHINDIGGEKSNFHGNFGQDYIKQFNEMIISFKYSSVLFK